MYSLEELEELFNNFNILGQDGITTHGSLHQGYAIDTSSVAPVVPIGFTGPGFPPPPPPFPPPPPIPSSGACCLSDGNCVVLPSYLCMNEGGIYHGAGTNCSTVDCPTAMGACCADDGSCSITIETECVGTYQGDGTVCDPNPCSLKGACCPSLIHSPCIFVTSAECAANGGHYFGDGTSCSIFDCSKFPCTRGCTDFGSPGGCLVHHGLSSGCAIGYECYPVGSCSDCGSIACAGGYTGDCVCFNEGCSALGCCACQDGGPTIPSVTFADCGNMCVARGACGYVAWDPGHPSCH